MSRILIVYGITYGHTERTAAECSTPWDAGRLNLGRPGRFGAPVWRSAVFGVASLHSDRQKALDPHDPLTRGRERSLAVGVRLRQEVMWICP